MSGSELPMHPSYDPQSLLNAQPVMVAVIDPATRFNFKMKRGFSGSEISPDEAVTKQLPDVRRRVPSVRCLRR